MTAHHRGRSAFPCRPALWLGLSLIVGGCGSSTSAPQESASPGTIDVPDGAYSAFDQCMLDSGFEISAIHEGYPGENRWYSWVSDLPSEQAAANMQECQKLAPPVRERSPEELRVIYDRWVEEARCLQELGYDPDPPPSFEKFAADWKTGPWMPIDGIDFSNWTTSEYHEAKDDCRLEMLDR